jgi:23S rRNA (uridine2552-2'-O)-methyltransferase
MPARKKAGKKNVKGANQWEDHLTRKARSEGYPARSVYKLMEIQNKYSVIKKNDTVLDLGCAPGSWLLYASRLAGQNGKVFGIDLKAIDIELPPNVAAVQGDILAMNEAVFWDSTEGLDAVLSDMAPATTGRKDVDALRSFELCEMALTVATEYLCKNGAFVCKIFQGNDFKAFQKRVKSFFQECRVFKPESCRKQSKEIYIIAKGMK